jgi:hypothetical protein
VDMKFRLWNAFNKPFQHRVPFDRFSFTDPTRECDRSSGGVDSFNSNAF